MKSGRFANQIVSLVGKVLLFDGNNIDLSCADGVIVKVLCETDAEIQQGSIYELVGHSNNDGTLQVSSKMLISSALEMFVLTFARFVSQLFVIRELSVDMDLDIYNRMVTEVQHNPRFGDYFAPIRT